MVKSDSMLQNLCETMCSLWLKNKWFNVQDSVRQNLIIKINQYRFINNFNKNPK